MKEVLVRRWPGVGFHFTIAFLFYRFLFFNFSPHPVSEKTKDRQWIIVRHFCLVRHEPCRVAPVENCTPAHKMGFYRQGRGDLNALYRVANIPDRKPVLSVKSETLK
jgi:hypothetical protein